MKTVQYNVQLFCVIVNTKTAQNDAYVICSSSCQNVSTQDSWHYICLSPEFLVSTNINTEREEYGCSGDKLCYVYTFLL